MESTKNGAIYLRLSREDGKETESESISNQRRMLMQFAQTHHITIAYEFIDDGVSGTTQNRKALQKMFRLIEEGCIRTVLVKDLSRLSRDYIHTGELVEEWFPRHDVRLISVSDGVDTGTTSPSNDVFAIRAVMDDWYARDISRKVRTAIRTKQLAGFCTSASLPFGYCRESDMIAVNQEQAEIIQWIFQEYTAGSSCNIIAQKLRNNGQQTAHSLSWSDTTVRRILMNPAYTGNLQLHKTEKFNYKSNHRISLPESEYISYSVPPIISEQQFTSAQKRIQANGHHSYPKHALAGLVFCAVCGAPMHISANEADGRTICSSRKRFQNCSAPSVKNSVLENAVNNILKADGIPENQIQYHKLISWIRVSPDIITVCMKYKSHHNVKK